MDGAGASLAKPYGASRLLPRLFGVLPAPRLPVEIGLKPNKIQDIKYCNAIRTIIGMPSIQPNMYLSIFRLPAIW